MNTLVTPFPTADKTYLWYITFSDIDENTQVDQGLIDLYQLNGAVAILDKSMKRMPADVRITKLRDVHSNLYNNERIIDEEIRIFTCSSLFCSKVSDDTYEASLLFPTKQVPSYLCRTSAWALSSYSTAKLWRCDVTCSAIQLMKYLYDALNGGWMEPFATKLFNGQKKRYYASTGTTLSNKSKAFRIIGEYSSIKSRISVDNCPLDDYTRNDINDAINELELCNNPRYEKQISMLTYLLKLDDKLSEQVY